MKKIINSCIVSIVLSAVSLLLISVKEPIDNTIYLFKNHIKVLTFENLSTHQFIVHYELEGLAFIFLSLFAITIISSLLIDYFIKNNTK